MEKYTETTRVCQTKTWSNLDMENTLWPYCSFFHFCIIVKKRTKPATLLQLSHSLIITIFLLLSGDIHPCPGPQHTIPVKDANPKADETTVSPALVGESCLLGVEGLVQRPMGHSTNVNICSGSPRGIGTIAQNVNKKLLNPAISKNRKWAVFRTVNDSRTVWDPRVKPKGLLGLDHTRCDSKKTRRPQNH